jgi:hypothetical protein
MARSSSRPDACDLEIRINMLVVMNRRTLACILRPELIPTTHPTRLQGLEQFLLLSQVLHDESYCPVGTVKSMYIFRQAESRLTTAFFITSLSMRRKFCSSSISNEVFMKSFIYKRAAGVMPVPFRRYYVVRSASQPLNNQSAVEVQYITCFLAYPDSSCIFREA